VNRELDTVQYRIEPLGDQHNRADFSCGVEALDRYLQKQAGQDASKHVAAVFVITPDGENIAGFHTLSAHVISLADRPDNVAKQLPRYPNVSATLLGRLAVSKNFRDRNVGELLLLDAFKRVLANTREVASAVVAVDAKDDRAREFYLRHDFIPLPKHPNRLFTPSRRSRNCSVRGESRNAISVTGVRVAIVVARPQTCKAWANAAFRFSRRISTRSWNSHGRWIALRLVGASRPLRLTAVGVKNRSALSGVAYKKSEPFFLPPLRPHLRPHSHDFGMSLTISRARPLSGHSSGAMRKTDSDCWSRVRVARIMSNPRGQGTNAEKQEGMGRESPIELWSPNLITFCFVAFGTDRLRREEAMRTAGRENPNRRGTVPRKRAHGAVGQITSRSIKWAEKQEKFQPKEMCFFLAAAFTVTYQELTRGNFTVADFATARSA
jgi:ribosomal protein S18 acetylase RimI-like enzyme